MERMPNKFQDACYKEVLNNGLEVRIIHKPGFVSSCAYFGTPYGALDAYQIVDGKEVRIPLGSAHFLEHKLFEDEEGDILGQFTRLGANANAFTSYEQTVYYFSTAKKDLRKPLNLLLDFVQKFSVTEESVEKEKDIIVQELLSYEQIPDMRIIVEMDQCLYENHLIRYDIAGSKESVYATKLSDLKAAYEYNYHPTKMKLVILSGENPEVLMGIIRENQKNKTFEAPKEVKRLGLPEPKKVHRKHRTLHMDVQIPKVAVAFKMDPLELDDWGRIKRELCFRYLLEASFGTCNSILQKWLDEGIVSDYFYYATDFNDDYAYLMFYNETEKVSSFLKRVRYRLRHLDPSTISEELLERLKKKFYGQAVIALDNMEDLGLNVLKSAYMHLDYYDYLNAIRSITKEDLVACWKEFDVNNSVSVTILPEEESEISALQ